MQLAQIGAIIRYEIKMQWRRRALPVMFAGILSLLLITILGLENLGEDLLPYDALGDDPGAVIDLPGSAKGEGASGITVGELRAAMNTYTVTLSWMVVLILALLAPPVLLADIIPRDRQLKVWPLLGSAPVGRAVYLAGKVLSVWLGLLIGILIIALLSDVFLRLRVGPYDMWAYLALLAVAIIPPMLFASGFSVLLASTQARRRDAVVLGILLTPLWTWVSSLALMHLYGVVVLVNPIYQFTPNAAQPRHEIIRQIVETLAQMALYLALAWAAAWAWMRWREGKS